MENAELRKTLREWLRQVLPADDAADLSYHLGDLHGAFLGAAIRIERLPSLPLGNDSPELRTALSGLMGEIYEHMPNHLEGAKARLAPWVSRLYQEADARGEL